MADAELTWYPRHTFPVASPTADYNGPVSFMVLDDHCSVSSSWVKVQTVIPMFQLRLKKRKRKMDVDFLRTRLHIVALAGNDTMILGQFNSSFTELQYHSLIGADNRYSTNSRHCQWPDTQSMDRRTAENVRSNLELRLF